MADTSMYAPHPRPESLALLALTAAMLVGRANPGNQRLAHALDKAALRLCLLDWHVDNGELRIQSFTHRSRFYVTDGEQCQCEARFRICWHRASWLIISVLAAACGTVQYEMAGTVLNLPPDKSDDED